MQKRPQNSQINYGYFKIIQQKNLISIHKIQCQKMSLIIGKHKEYLGIKEVIKNRKLNTKLF